MKKPEEIISELAKVKKQLANVTARLDNKKSLECQSVFLRTELRFKAVALLNMKHSLEWVLEIGAD